MTDLFLRSEVFKSDLAYEEHFFLDADYLRCLALLYCDSEHQHIKGILLSHMIAKNRSKTTKIISKMCRLTSIDMQTLSWI